MAENRGELGLKSFSGKTKLATWFKRERERERATKIQTDERQNPGYPVAKRTDKGTKLNPKQIRAMQSYCASHI